MDALLYKLRVVSEYALIQQAVACIEGYLLPIEGYLLYLLARHGEGVGEIVEVGSFMGLSTCWLALGSAAAGREKVSAIDTFQGSPEHQAGGPCENRTLVEEGTTFNRFKGNIERLQLAEHVNPIVASSREAASNWNKPIRLLFIDGEHSYSVCALDFQRWSPFIVPRGYIAFHDYANWEGVTRFYDELMRDNDAYREVAGAGSVRAIQLKPE